MWGGGANDGQTNMPKVAGPRLMKMFCFFLFLIRRKEKKKLKKKFEYILLYHFNSNAITKCNFKKCF